MTNEDLRATLLDQNCQAYHALLDAVKEPEAKQTSDSINRNIWWENVEKNILKIRESPTSISDAANNLHSNGSDLIILEAIVQRTASKSVFELAKLFYKPTPYCSHIYDCLISREEAAFNAMLAIPSEIYGNLEINRFRLGTLANRNTSDRTKEERNELSDYQSRIEAFANANRTTIANQQRRLSGSCEIGKLRTLLANIEDGAVKTAKECEALTGKFPTYFRGEVKRSKHDRKDDILKVLESLK